MTLNNIAQDHFSLFGLPKAYVLDAVALERAYREIQARIHPDKFVNAGEAEKRASMQWSTRVNEAYRMLKDCWSRRDMMSASRPTRRWPPLS